MTAYGVAGWRFSRGRGSGGEEGEEEEERGSVGGGDWKEGGSERIQKQGKKEKTAQALTNYIEPANLPEFVMSCPH